ncbi:LuxR C-terminal-related transcriptional regulator [Nocardiopsis exhalans]|uniref:LuxR C-terminal-related transcriptional regulator n=1 Tax=Nocardiopsis exhalans TaxID=163604 RepID=A0ABY5D3N4_9ACTN|nr:LuxR C-terminal-related transcriptional regulator [Nocardiopsis exhalans]USY17817.1 LuxR C-terminal-related transcriptional regulator [Nocardiopsis exhalans]
MGELAQVVEHARHAARDLRWSEAYRLLRGTDPTELSPDDFVLFADASWWCCRVPEEIELRQRAFRGFVRSGRPREAAYTAWMLSVRYGLHGEPVASSGWLRRAQRQLEHHPDCVESGYLACGEAEAALGAGEVDRAEAHARRALVAGERFGAPNLVALALSWQGLCHLVRGEADDGLRLLDEAMASVVSGELDAHFTGWISCFAVGMCMGVADLRRAASWAQTAWNWASSLPEATPYQGLCRVRQVEVMCLRGELAEAATEARRACEEMLLFEPHLAGEAFYVTGEILRRRGETSAAEQAFGQARELGHDPQPGLAMIRLAQGRTDAAMTALRAALADSGGLPFRRASLLAAQVRVALAADRPDLAGAACEDLDTVAEAASSEAVSALAGATRARLRLALGNAEPALALLRPAMATWRALGLACELAEARLLTGMALRTLGDEEGSELELDAARRLFTRLGAHTDQLTTRTTVDGARPGGLSDRECEVLRLVAAGYTNRRIAAELVLSEHTVARHLSNIYPKLGVSSRTAATAFAFEHGLVRREGSDGPF